MLALGPLALWACESSSTGEGSGPVTTSPTVTSTAPTAPTGTSTDAAPPDAGEDGATDPIPNARTLKLLNLSTIPAINACLRKDGTTDPFMGPLFRSAGIPPSSLSARFAYNLPSGNGELKIIAATDGCEDAALRTIVLNLATQGDDSHLGVYFTGPGQPPGSFAELLTPTPGKEAVLTQPPYSNAIFTRDDGVGTPVQLRGAASKPVAVEPNLVGKITLLGIPGVERPMRTVAGGTISLWTTATSIILCDERAAAVDGLANCGATLRAP
jgi:hypothetical protein